VHYRRGQEVLIIENEVDKARFDRELPLGTESRDALDRACPQVGIIFGEHDSFARLRLELVSNAIGRTGSATTISVPLGSLTSAT
jgi:hypothetical protein